MSVMCRQLFSLLLLLGTVSFGLVLWIQLRARLDREQPPSPPAWPRSPWESVCEPLLRGQKAFRWKAAVGAPAPTVGAPLPRARYCERLVSASLYPRLPTSQEETDFPLAFILTVNKEFETLESLFRAIYRSHNLYCFSMDVKSPGVFQGQVEALQSCFPNVFLVSKSEPIVYAGFSRLQADINCMRDLLAMDHRWKYVINLCGQDYPLKTNLEIVRYLKSFKGMNLTPGILPPNFAKLRTKFVFKTILSPSNSRIVKTQKLKSRPPHGLTIYFGSAYYALTQDFVRFLFKDRRALDLLEWSKDTYSPDEHYWVTLNRIPGVPGSMPPGIWEGNLRAIKWRFLKNGKNCHDAPGADPNAEWEGSIRSIKWVDQAKKYHDGCKGHYVRSICVYGLGDLQWLSQKDSLFANKFEVNKYPLAAQCMHCGEWWLRPKMLSQSKVPTRDEWLIKNHVCIFGSESNDCSI